MVVAFLFCLYIVLLIKRYDLQRNTYTPDYSDHLCASVDDYFQTFCNEPSKMMRIDMATFGKCQEAKELMAGCEDYRWWKQWKFWQWDYSLSFSWFTNLPPLGALI